MRQKGKSMTEQEELLTIIGALTWGHFEDLRKITGLPVEEFWSAIRDAMATIPGFGALKENPPPPHPWFKNAK